MKTDMPVWHHTLDVKDVFHNEELEFEEIRDTIVARLKRMTWVKQDEEVDHVVTMLGYSQDITDFDYHWHQLYDYADRDRIWISTF